MRRERIRRFSVRFLTLWGLVSVASTIGCTWFDASDKASIGDPTSRPESRPDSRPFAERLPDWPIENAARVNAGLYRGAEPDDHAWAFLREKGIKTVVDLRSWSTDRKDVEAAGMRSVEIPLRADLLGSRAPTDEEIDRFLAVVRDPEQQPVFVHCAHGVDRTGTMIAVYRIAVDGWSNDEAVREMLDFGYHTYYKSLIEFVRSYRPRK